MYNNTEGDVGGLSRRALLLEEDVERLAYTVDQQEKDRQRKVVFVVGRFSYVVAEKLYKMETRVCFPPPMQTFRTVGSVL